MPTKSFNDRLAALEALEAEADLVSIADAQVDALSDDAVFAEAWRGLRMQTITPFDGALFGVDTYWRAIADRATDLCYARQVLVCPLTADEIARAIAALGSGRYVLDTRRDHVPTYYSFLPPTPYPGGCWETEEYKALVMVNRALHVVDAWGGAGPEDSAACLDWLASLG